MTDVLGLQVSGPQGVGDTILRQRIDSVGLAASAGLSGTKLYEVVPKIVIYWARDATGRSTATAYRKFVRYGFACLVVAAGEGVRQRY